MSRRLAVLALAAFVVGLAVHNLVMAALWDVGLRGRELDVAAAWKEALLVAALGAVLWRSRTLPIASVADRLALVYAAIIVLYALIPQSLLDGDATTRGVLLALRHHLIPVAAYGLGRLAALSVRDRGRLLALTVGTAVAVAVVGILDAYLVPLQWWRDSGVPGWYREQLGLTYEGLSGLPENWVYNTGDETNPVRRLVSTFLSPLAAAYLLVVVLLLLAAEARRRWLVLPAALAYIALLLTHTRAAYVALAAGLIVLAIVRRRWWPAIAAAVAVVAAVGFLAVYEKVGPSTSYTAQELEFLRANAAANPDAGSDPLAADESSTASHLRNLRDGLEVVVRHPQGYGLGNAGVTAKRTGVEIKAGESTYSELGVDAGVAGVLAFIAWNLAIVVGLWRRSAWLTAAFASVLLLGLQTDVIGVHWLAFCLWAAAGVALGPDPRAGEGSSVSVADESSTVRTKWTSRSSNSTV